MQFPEGNPDALRDQFWSALAESPFLMLQLESDPHTAAPMTAQLDADAHHAIWFFIHRDHKLAALGKADATFASKGHEVFARFHGALTEETDRATLDRHWTNAAQAWFPGGKDDPTLLFARMDLGEATIWQGKLGAEAMTKIRLGQDVRDEVAGTYAETDL